MHEKTIEMFQINQNLILYILLGYFLSISTADKTVDTKFNILVYRNFDFEIYFFTNVITLQLCTDNKITI